MKKKNVKVTSFIFLITLSITLLSCETTPETKADNNQENKTVVEKKIDDTITKKKIKIDQEVEVKLEVDKNNKPPKKNTRIVLKEAPDWYNYPPSSDVILYTLGTAKSTSMQFALDKATDWAKQKLAVMIERKVYMVTKNFFGNTNANQKSLYSDLLDQFSRKISLNALSSLRIKERDVRAIGNYFVAFSLIELSLASLSKNIDDAMRFYNIEFSELKSDKSIIELSNELKKLKSTDLITE